MRFRELAINDPSGLLFGHAPRPVTTTGGLVFGAGTVYPELNFTLTPTSVSRERLPALRSAYRDIVEGALNRAVELHSAGVVLEFETLIEMTRTPDIGVALVETIAEVCARFHTEHGLKTALRLTPNDLREFERPPRMRSTDLLGPMMELFERGAEAGGDLLSIESTGGKEISDDALMQCDIGLFVFSQAVLGVRDVRMLWERIVDVARRTGRIAGGDTACAFGNTAMVLAERRYIPRVVAAIARVATVVRSLAAVEAGATGPDKDCGYEGPYLKAIAGIPISMEGKTAACAHGSPVGNIAAACADLWSNESVQNVKLLADDAPVVCLEQLEYDTRLMNRAIATGTRQTLQRLFVESDRHLDPQAFVLDPEVVIPVARAMVSAETALQAARDGCLVALDRMEQAVADGRLAHDPMEAPWYGTLRAGLEAIPDTEEAFVATMAPRLDRGRILLHEYGL